MRLAATVSVLCLTVLWVRSGAVRKRKVKAVAPFGDRLKVYPLLQRIVKAGGHRGLQECQRQFKNDPWNCTLNNKNVYKELPIFVKTTLPYATPETALLHAISSAAITHEITLQCRQHKIPGCGCVDTKNRPAKGNGDWQWGGCSDNIWFGENKTKSFIDSLESPEQNARSAVNLHNNEVGRKVVRSNLKRECKCHGVTGSCNLKTCWRSLAPFGKVGAELKRKYRQAVKVTLVDNALRDQKSKTPVERRDKKLVYLDSSPDFCVRNLTVGTPGMLGRTCSSDDISESKCQSLCNSCKLNPQTEPLEKQVDCRCKFVWCCSIKCEKCRQEYSLTTCTKR